MTLVAREPSASLKSCEHTTMVPMNAMTPVILGCPMRYKSARKEAGSRGLETFGLASSGLQIAAPTGKASLADWAKCERVSWVFFDGTAMQSHFG